jgi:hypothetical protein
MAWSRLMVATRMLLLPIATATLLACQRSEPSAKDRYGNVGPGEGARHSSGYVATKESPELRQRADSLAALDPRSEAAASIQRGDLRYLAVCRVTCAPIGAPGDTVCFIQGCSAAMPGDLRVIDGAGNPERNADAAQLDRVAGSFGARYNFVIRAYRKRRRARLVT